MLSGIVLINRNGLRCYEAPHESAFRIASTIAGSGGATKGSSPG
jgi:hypothetical protein